jgi:hypothetical protein
MVLSVLDQPIEHAGPRLDAAMGVALMSTTYAWTPCPAWSGKGELAVGPGALVHAVEAGGALAYVQARRAGRDPPVQRVPGATTLRRLCHCLGRLPLRCASWSHENSGRGIPRPILGLRQVRRNVLRRMRRHHLLWDMHRVRRELLCAHQRAGCRSVLSRPSVLRTRHVLRERAMRRVTAVIRAYVS